MTHSLTTIRTFSPVAGKTGKVSTTATRAHTAISAASNAVQLGLLVHGSTITKRTAATGFQIVTLDSMLALPALDGSQWPDVYALMADKFGYAIEGGKGKAACKALAEFAQTSIDAKKIVAEHDGLTDGQYKALAARQALLDNCMAAFTRWDDASRAASAQASLNAANLTDAPTVSATVADTATM